MYVERKDADTSLVSPCCAARGQLLDNKDLDFYTNSYLQRLREENRAGVASAECQVCWDQERFTNSSLRLASLNRFKNNLTSTPHLTTLDWNVEPICNAKCIICSNYHSSAWLAEDQKFNHAAYPIYRTASSARHNDIIDAIDLGTVQRVYFNGGEPVLSNDPVRILTKLQNIGKLSEISVSFNMNGSRMPSQQLIDLLREARDVTVFVSIDGTQQQFEYIRYPIAWSELEHNVKCIMDLGFDDLCMSTALGIHNIQLAQQTEDWWNSFTDPYRKHIKIYNTYQLVVGPLAITTASARLRDVLLPQLNSQRTAEKFAANCLITADGKDNWLPWLRMIDHRRNLDWTKTFPNLYSAGQAAGVIK
jgi:hypothetical protein